MLRLIILVLMFACVSHTANCHDAIRDFKQFSITDKQLGNIHFYVTQRDINKCKPLLLLLDGSGDRPLFRYKIDAVNKGSRMVYMSFPIDYYDSLAARYHVVLISKPAIPMADSFLYRRWIAVLRPRLLPYTIKYSLLSGEPVQHRRSLITC